MFNFKLHKRKRTNAMAMLFGFCLSLSSFLVLSFALSLILAMFKNPLSFLGIFSVAALLISGAISGFITAKFKGEGAFFPVTASAFFFALLILGCGLIITKGALPIISFVNLLAYVALALVFGIIARRKRKRRR